MGKAVLVVEDELSLQKVIAKLLHKKGFEVFVASSASEAMSQLTNRPEIDCIWLDHYLLNNETGMDLLDEIKKNRKWKKLPVFVVTNSIDEEKNRSYSKYGVSHYYIKSNTSIYKVVADLTKTLKGEACDQIIKQD